MDKKDFLKIIKDQRAKKTDKKFEGTLIDYVELVQQNPSIAKLAHKRLYDAIVDHGVDEMSSEDGIFNWTIFETDLTSLTKL